MKIYLKILTIIIMQFLIINSFNNCKIYSLSNTWERINFNKNYNSFYCVQQLHSEKYIVTGIIRIGSSFKIYTVKFNSYGDTIYSRVFNQSLSSQYTSAWINETEDKGYIIAGTGPGSISDAYLVKMDSSGSIQWYRNYGGIDLDQGYCVKQTLNKGYILLARTFSFGFTQDLLIIKTDSLGVIQWQKLIDRGGEDFPGEIDLTIDNGYIISWKSPKISYLLKLNINGDSLWQKEYTTIGINSTISLSDGGYLIGGTKIENGVYKSSIIKTDSFGKMVWQRSYNTIGFEECFNVCERNDNKAYALCGWADTSIFGGNKHAMYKIIDLNGNLLFEKLFRPGLEQNRFRHASKTFDNGFIFAGIAGIENNGGYGYLVKTDSIGNIKVSINENSIENVEGYSVSQNYPNPFNNLSQVIYSLNKTSIVTFELYNVLGKLIQIEQIGQKQIGNYKYTIDSNNFSSGLYFYVFKFGNVKILKKLIVLK